MNRKFVLVGLSISLVIGVVFINVLSHVEKKKRTIYNVTSMVTTTAKKTDELESNEKIDKVIIEGEEDEIIVKNYSSHLGFNFYYEKSLFNPVLLSNGSVQVTDIFDSNIYVIFEKLTDTEYYQSYENLNGVNEESEDGYLTTYSFYRGNNIYLKVTKKIINNSEYLSGLNIRMDYIINSLQFN